jgi:hypothetical protein
LLARRIREREEDDNRGGQATFRWWRERKAETNVRIDIATSRNMEKRLRSESSIRHSLASVRHHDLSGHVFVASSAKNAAVKVKCSDFIRDESDPCYLSGLDLGLKFQVGDRKAMNAIERGKLEYDGASPTTCTKETKVDV